MPRMSEHTEEKPELKLPDCPKCGGTVDTTAAIDEKDQVVIIASCQACQSVANAIAEGITPDMLDTPKPAAETVKAWLMAQSLAIARIVE